MVGRGGHRRFEQVARTAGARRAAEAGDVEAQGLERGEQAQPVGRTATGEAIARRLEVGAVNINDVYTNSFVMDLPLGGWKTSVLGSRNGPDGIRKYCRQQAIVASRIPLAKREPLWFPYGRKQRAMAARLFRRLVTGRRTLRSRH